MTLIDGVDTVLFTMSATIEPAITRRPGDFMATVWVREGQLQAEFRYRWHNTAHKIDMNGSADDDEKSFWSIGPVADSPAAREKMCRTFEELAKRIGGLSRVWSERGEWTVEQFHDVLLRSPMTVQLTSKRGGQPS